jgi:hypothetical protein
MKYGIETNVEADAYPDDHRGKWSVRIFFEEVTGPGGHTTRCNLVESEGRAVSKSEAANIARRFTRWAIRAYDLFGLVSEEFDGD